MADKDQTSTAQAPKTSTVAPSVAPRTQGRDRAKPRMSEGVRAEIAANGFAIDPGTGRLLTGDADDKGQLSNVQVVPQEQATRELKRLTEELAERRESVTPSDEPAL